MANELRAGALYKFLDREKKPVPGRAWMVMTMQSFQRWAALADSALLECAARTGLHAVQAEIQNSKRRLAKLEQLEREYKAGKITSNPVGTTETIARVLLVIDKNNSANGPETIGYSYFSHKATEQIKKEMGEERALEEETNRWTPTPTKQVAEPSYTTPVVNTSNQQATSPETALFEMLTGLTQSLQEQNRTLNSLLEKKG